MKRIFGVVLIIFTCFLIVGCNNKEGKYSNKLEIKVDQGKTLVFYFKNDKVSSYKEYFEYKDTDEAKEALTITENELNDEEVINIYRDKNYVVLEYSNVYIEREFKNLSKKEIIDIYSIYEKNH